MSGEEVADLYVTFRAVSTPFTEAADKAALAGERFAAVLDKVTASSDRAAVSVGKAAAATNRFATAADKVTAAVDRESAATDKAAAATDRVSVSTDKAAAVSTKAAAASDKAAASTTKATVAIDKNAVSAERGGKIINTAGKDTAIGLGIASVASLKMAGDFDASIRRLITSAGELPQNYQTVSSGILQIARDTGTSAQQLANEGGYVIESAGRHGTEALQVLRAAAEGARMEGADLKPVADAITSTMQDYSISADKAAWTTSKLVAAVGAGKSNFEEFTGALHSVLPAAMGAKIPLDNILAAMSSMTVHGMSAQQSAENLGHAIQHLQTVTGPQAKELALLGIDARQLSDDLRTKGLTGAVQEVAAAIQKNLGPDKTRVILDLQAALSKLPPAVQDLGQKALDGSISWGEYSKATKNLGVEAAGQAAQFATLAKSTHGIGTAQQDGQTVMQTYSSALKAAMGDSTGLNVALMLTGDNLDYTNKAVQAVSNATVDASGNVQGWGEIQDSFNFKLSKMKEALETNAITLGDKLIPKVMAVVDWFERNSGVAKTLAEIVGGMLTVAMAKFAVTAGIDTVKSLMSVVEWVTKATTTTRDLALLTQSGSFFAAFTAGETKVQGVRNALDLAKGSAKGVATEVENVGSSAGKLDGALSGTVGMLTGPWGAAITAAGILLGGLAIKHEETKQKVSDLTDALKQDSGAIGDNTRAKIANMLETDGVLKSAQALGLSLWDVTAAATGDKDAQKTLTDQLEKADISARKNIDSTGGLSKKGQEMEDQIHQVNTAVGKYSDQLNQAGSKMDEDRAKADRLDEALGKLPSNHVTDVQVNTLQAVSALNDLAARMSALRGTTISAGTLRVNFEKNKAQGGIVSRYASGGEIRGFPGGGPVYGPGTSTSDSIPAMLSDGEFVINARSTAIYRPLLEAINSGSSYGGSQFGGSVATSDLDGDTMVINVNIAGSVVSERQLVDTIRTQILQYRGRNPNSGLSY